ncbi:Adenine phosphoribosyltransferase [Spiroplasma sp. JKS002669]|uniref:adenine phosphoribosyltransferase n=1 Tax=Spiroplasma attinicola TaxID=2904537 RepID=UPI002022C8FD|nr:MULTISPECIES: adenine phosphoribosyltransferase [unclassified Spiroplasma]MCL6428647.1 Adenine phosphoribosyltransferase [Spiroplasma sp. JKS002669]MCL8209989.1 Adenine phosphoribosyltransferase [Spiroplasma sp. JKS002670]
MNLDTIKKMIRNVPNFPKSGIQFKDITPVLANPEAFSFVIKTFADLVKKDQITAIAAPEARGFIFGSALALALKVKFVPIRKSGKLPAKTYHVEYQLEYGTDKLEIHQDALTKNDRVLIIDDLIATSGTIHACIELVQLSQAQVAAIATLITLKEFEDQQKFGKIPFHSLIEF